MTLLTIVFGFRDRDMERVERCLASLVQQSFQDFEVLFVDYGSQPAVAAAAHSLTARYPFCHYLYSDSRGLPWNRSHALNTGGRRVTTPYLMTSDVDMVYPPHFLEIMMEHASEERHLYCPHYFLPEGFDDWNNLEAYSGRLERANQDALGGCQLVPTAIFQKIRGFDEYYRYWGREDRDLHERLVGCHLQPMWLQEKVSLFHQWHPKVNFKTVGFMPPGTWGRMQNHFMRYRGQVIRNNGDWGHIYQTEQRPILKFIDETGSGLRENSSYRLVDENPDEPASLEIVMESFWTLPAGTALAVNHAFYPPYHSQPPRLLRYTNELLYRAGSDVRLGYGYNSLHTYLAELIEYNQDILADYYLGLQTMNGLSLLLKRE